MENLSTAARIILFALGMMTVVLGVSFGIPYLGRGIHRFWIWFRRDNEIEALQGGMNLLKIGLERERARSCSEDEGAVSLGGKVHSLEQILTGEQVFTAQLCSRLDAVEANEKRLQRLLEEEKTFSLKLASKVVELEKKEVVNSTVIDSVSNRLEALRKEVSYLMEWAASAKTSSSLGDMESVKGQIHQLRDAVAATRRDTASLSSAIVAANDSIKNLQDSERNADSLQAGIRVWTEKIEVIEKGLAQVKSNQEAGGQEYAHDFGCAVQDIKNLQEVLVGVNATQAGLANKVNAIQKELTDVKNKAISNSVEISDQKRDHAGWTREVRRLEGDTVVLKKEIDSLEKIMSETKRTPDYGEVIDEIVGDLTELGKKVGSLQHEQEKAKVELHNGLAEMDEFLKETKTVSGDEEKKTPAPNGPSKAKNYHIHCTQEMFNDLNAVRGAVHSIWKVLDIHDQWHKGNSEELKELRARVVGEADFPGIPGQIDVLFQKSNTQEKQHECLCDEVRNSKVEMEGWIKEAYNRLDFAATSRKELSNRINEHNSQLVAIRDRLQLAGNHRSEQEGRIATLAEKVAELDVVRDRLDDYRNLQERRIAEIVGKVAELDVEVGPLRHLHVEGIGGYWLSSHISDARAVVEKANDLRDKKKEKESS